MVLLTGLLVLLGWAFDIAIFKSGLPGLQQMMPNTAIAFALAGGSLVLVAGEPVGRWSRRMAQGAGWIVSLIGALTLGEYLFSLDPGLDRLFFKDSLPAIGNAGRPALLTAINFLSFGLALLLLDVKRVGVRQWVEILIAVPIEISLLALIGYACNVPSFYGWMSLFPGKGMALHTAVAFVVLGLGILCARPDRGLMQVIASRSAGGVVARRLLLAPVVIPLLTGLALGAARRAGFYNAEFAGWLLSFLNIFIFTLVIWWVAALLRQADGVRQKAELALREANEHLEKRVQERVAELAQIDERLRSSEARFRAVFEQAAVGVAQVGPDGRWLEVNGRVAAIVGYSREELLTKSFQDITHPEDLATDLGQVRQMLAGVIDHYALEKRYIRKDGSLVWINLTVSLVRDAAGAPLYFISIVEDIDVRKRLELALLEGEERFRTMANSMSQLAWIARADGFIFWYNQRWYDYTGTTPEQMEGWGWQSVHDPAELPKVMANWTEAITSGKPFEMEFPLRGVDGRFRTFLTRGQPLKDADGHVVQWFGTNTDVEVLKQALEQLRRSEEFNRRIIESSSDCIKVLDLEARLLSMSEGGQRLLEIQDLTRYLNSCWISFWQPGDQPRVREAVEAARAGGMGRFQAFSMTEAGNPRWWDVIVTPIRGASGQVEQLLSISRDISAQNQAEEKIRQLNAELEQRVIERTTQLETANRELEAFSYSVSHDLRAPLRGVDGYVRMLQEDYGDRLDAEGRRLIGVVSSEAKRMGRLIDDLLAFSRMGRQQMQRTPVDMTALAQGVFENLRGEAPETTPRLELKPLPPALGDAALLRQVFANLLGNAVKFSRHHAAPVIEVGAAEGPEETTYHVKDNGVGFDEKYAHKLFGVFQRLHSEAEFEGTGVGLAFVQRVIQRHGGRVWAEGRPGAGATFFFTLPNPKEPRP